MKSTKELIEEQISKLHSANNVKANPLLNTDLGSAIVDDIVKIRLREANGVEQSYSNCNIPCVMARGTMMIYVCEHDEDSDIKKSFTTEQAAIDYCTVNKCWHWYMIPHFHVP